MITAKIVFSLLLDENSEFLEIKRVLWFGVILVIFGHLEKIGPIAPDTKKLSEISY